MDNEKEIQVSLDVPGVKQRALGVTSADGVMRIAGARRKFMEVSKVQKKLRLVRKLQINLDTVAMDHLTANLEDCNVMVSQLPRSQSQVQSRSY